MSSLRIRWSPGWRSRSAGLLLLALAASTLVIGLTSPAKASTCTPNPQCSQNAYQVTGTPDNSLAEWSAPPGDPGAAVLRSVPNGTTLYVSCQIPDGPQIDLEFNIDPNGAYVPSRTWDYVYDPGINQFVWVYDWWMNTPPQQAAYNWYSWPDTAHACTQ